MPMKKDIPVWDKGLPKNHKSKPMTTKQVAQAKAMARSAGRPYPNAVDNIRVSKASKKS
jgi:hypothetical protein